MSRIAVFGAAGKAGSRVVAEAAARGHRVTAVARDLDALTALHTPSARSARWTPTSRSTTV
ncbi:NAD(P)H-binding protein [Streptomyces sp. NPDC015661]|uniref:NmrA family NAD(P)-binding protein n=1 Tax=Streptomyces sp. NPDC015661 TaxID=3364961 RepID=UPI0036FF19E3